MMSHWPITVCCQWMSVVHSVVSSDWSLSTTALLYTLLVFTVSSRLPIRPHLIHGSLGHQQSAAHPSDQHTDRATCDSCSNRPHHCTASMQCGLKKRAVLYYDTYFRVLLPPLLFKPVLLEPIFANFLQLVLSRTVRWLTRINQACKVTHCHTLNAPLGYLSFYI